MAGLRQDIESAYLDITEFTGQSLTGPRELISRKVLCSNVQQVMSEAQAINVAQGAQAAVAGVINQLQQLNFRILSTSPGACLNAKVELVLPMLFHHFQSHTGAAVAGILHYDGVANAGVSGFCAPNLAGQIAPRRNGILKACRTISSTINSTVSFTVRPGEGLDVMEQIFTQPGVGGMTGVYNDEEGPAWGNTDGMVGQNANANPRGAGPVGAHRAANSAPCGDLVRVRNIWRPTEGGVKARPNNGYCARRADFRAGGGAEDGGVKPSTIANNGFFPAETTAFVKYDYRTTLSIPPFKTFNKDIYCRTPTWIPYADSIDLQLSFKSVPEIKAALLSCASLMEGGNTAWVQKYDFGFYAQPYLKVEWVVPPMQLRPSYTLPCWRNQHYSQVVPFNVAGPAGDVKKAVTFQGIRLDSLPSLISVHVTDGAEYKTMSNTTAWAAKRYNWTEYFGKITDFSLTINEKLSILSDKDNYDLYKLYRMYAPDSKMSYTTWRELRQVILIRSDVLAVDKGQAIYNPTNLTINCQVSKAVQHIGQVVNQEIHLNFWYFNDALTLSQQAAAVTSLLLSPSEVQQLRVTPEAKEIQTLMEMGLQS